MNQDLSQFIDINFLKRMLVSFKDATGIHASFVDTDGRYIIRPESACDFCEIVQANAEGAEACRLSRKRAGSTASGIGETYISRCHAGMVCLTMAIFCDNEHIGSLVCGPMTMWKWDSIAENEMRDYLGALRLDMDNALFEAAKLKQYGSKSVRGASDMLFALAAKIAQNGEDKIRYNREMSEQQAVISALIAEKKKEEARQNGIAESKDLFQSRKIEHELISRVADGDETGAKQILNELLGEIFFHIGGDMQMIKMRLVELLVILSRAAAEGGADSKVLLMMNSRFIHSIENTDSYEHLCKYIIEALDAFLNCVSQSSSVKNGEYVHKTILLLKSRFREDISLAGVADELHISQFYLSHSFKSKMGISFVEYLTQIRLDEACWLLKNTSLGIGTVGEQVGYVNPGYFSKIFKKNKGVTPDAYRRNCKIKQ